MVRLERGAEELVLEMDHFGAEEEQRCRAKGLETREERASCVETAAKAVQATQTVVQALKAALETFWRLYPELEAKLEGGEKVSVEDLGVLFTVADQVRDEYAKLVPLVRSIRGSAGEPEARLVLHEAEVVLALMAKGSQERSRR